MKEETKAEEHAQTILLVDDLPANLDLLSGMLKSRGYRTREAVSGEAALRAVAAEPPDLILLDVNMPGINGFEVCERLKADERSREIPVLFLSALSDTLDKVKAFRVGGEDYISKPFRLEEVEARVSTHLELRRQRVELRESYDKLRVLERMRDAIVHMMVHDLRSPLSAVDSFLTFLQKDAGGALSPAAMEDISESRKALRVLIGMVSDMLDASKLEEGKMKLSLSECELGGVLESAAGLMELLARKRRLIVDKPEAPVMITADCELLTRIIQNLVSNGLKYAPLDGGYVRLGVKTSEGRVRVTVENNGPHIPAEYHARIFEKFGQVDPSGKRMAYSTGLGLSFCKLAVEAHGGDIGVESVPGGTTVFWFELKK